MCDIEKFRKIKIRHVWSTYKTKLHRGTVVTVNGTKYPVAGGVQFLQGLELAGKIARARGRDSAAIRDAWGNHHTLAVASLQELIDNVLIWGDDLWQEKEKRISDLQQETDLFVLKNYVWPV